MASAEERDMIERRMAQTGIKNMRAYMLKMAVDGRVIHVELESVREMVRLLSNATNNINQIAKRANETGNIYASDVEELRERYDAIWGQAKEILRKLAAL
jgi:transcriptional regulator of met regulon